MIDRQGELGWNETARGLDSFYDRALTMLASPRVKTGVRPLAREARAPRRLRPDHLRPELPAGPPAGRGGRPVRDGLLLAVDRRMPGTAAAGTLTARTSTTSRIVSSRTPTTPFPTLIEDLASRGLLDETLIVWMGEFGRSPRVATTKQFGANGRDHWPHVLHRPLCRRRRHPGRNLRVERPHRRLPGDRPCHAPTTSPPQCSGHSASTPRPSSTTHSNAP